MKRDLYLGWIAVGLSTLVACLWAFWGTIECFHEGWWLPTLSGRLLQSLAYLSLMGASMALTLISIWRPKIGATLMFLAGAWFSWFILAPRWGRLDLAAFLSWIPVTLMVVGGGLLWWWGKPKPLKLAYTIAIVLPLLVAIGCAIEPVWRVAHRLPDDGVRTERLVEGNGVTLIWAPEGPGWVRDAKHSVTWAEAMDIASRLSADGTYLEDQPVNIWRLPTVDEAVRSFTRHGENAGGVWDAANARATYRVRPDKEPPLWRVYAETIYWWTATEAGSDKAYRIVYNGEVYSSSKSYHLGSIGFRAVKSVPGTN
jgi:hypothetical protein